MDSENRLCVLLVGLTELRRRLAMAVHESLSQRLVVRHHLTGLDRDELDAYLTHRLRLAGCEIPLFDPPRRARSLKFAQYQRVTALTVSTKATPIHFVRETEISYCSAGYVSVGMSSIHTLMARCRVAVNDKFRTSVSATTLTY